ncbi:MAG: thioredoxin family protein [Pseudomonadota bacterium]
MFKPIVSGLLAALLLISGAAIANAFHSEDEDAQDEAHDYPEARSYTVSDDASGDVDAALVRAAENEKRVLLVMGANWCHDSRALAGWLGTERFKALIDEQYELVFVNVGTPQSEGDGHNLHIARRFGLEELPGTPNVLVVTSQGALLNAETATTWRNAASRDEDVIYEELEALAKRAK